jgi:hypothetical protein
MYKLSINNMVIRLTDNACIPMVKGNADYDQYLVWLSEGNTPIPADNPRIQEIYNELDSIDRKCIRALRENDTARITQYEQQAETLRIELRGLLG